MRKKNSRPSADRLTVSLGAGQRRALKEIAKRNHAGLAFVVRYALSDFMKRHPDAQVSLSRQNSPR